MLRNILASVLLFSELLVFNYSGLGQQNSVDSINRIISNSRHDLVKISELLVLGDLFKGSNPDTARYFYEKALSISDEKQNIEYLRWSAFTHVKIAQTFIYQGNYEKALQHNLKAEKLTRKNSWPNIEALVENIKGLLCFNQGEYDEALENYEKAFKQAENSKDKSLMAKIYSNMGIIHYIKGDYKNAIDLFNKPVEIGRELKDHELLSGSLINLGIVYLNLGMSDSAYACYNQSAKVYKEMNSLDGLLLCHQNIGNIFYSKGEYNQALDAYREALAYATQLENKPDIGHLLHDIAEVYMRMGDYENSLNYYLKALEQKEKLSDKMGMATSYQGIGSLHFLFKNNEKALSYNEEALKLFREMDYQTGIAGALCNISNIFSGKDSLDTALNYYQEVLTIYRESGDKTALSDVLLNIGNLYFEKGEYNKAVQNFNQSLSLKIELDDKDGMAWGYYYLSMLNYKTEKFTKSIEFGNKALELAEQIHALPTLSSVTEVLMNAYKEVGNQWIALIFAQEHIMLRDSLFQKEKTESMAQAEMRWQSEKKQAQIVQLEKQQELHKVELELKKQETQKQQLIIYGVILLLAFLIVTIILILRTNKRKKDLLYQKQLSRINQLKMQNIQNRISPHFFFNALNTAVIPLKNYPEQKKAFDNLIFLLRRSLENAEKSFIPLADELDIVDSYVELQNMRMNGEIQYHKNIVLNGQAPVIVPAMVLQIPVENAIKHGLKPLDGDKKLWVECIHHGSRIGLMVADNGVGRKASEYRTSGTGTGLRVLLQTIEILNLKNEKKIVVAIEDGNSEAEKEGTRVKISIPTNYKFEI
jgi:tetratricopeptide (TPR) repeat protein